MAKTLADDETQTKTTEFRVPSKKILEEYAETKAEIQELDKRIQEKRLKLARYTTDKTKSLMSKGAAGFTSDFEDYDPKGTYELIEIQLERNLFILETRRYRLLEQENKVEEFISSLPLARMRRYATMHYVQGMKWKEVAAAEGGRYNELECIQYFKYHYDKLVKAEQERVKQLEEEGKTRKQIEEMLNDTIKAYTYGENKED